MKVTINQAWVEGIKKALGEFSKNHKRELATAINATAKRVRTQAAKQIKTELKVAAKVLKKAIYQKAKASAKNTSTTIGFFEGYPIPLKYFGAKTLQNGDLSFKIKPKGMTVRTKQLFVVKAYGNNIYSREGKGRGPLKKWYGPSPGSVYKQLRLVEQMTEFAQIDLPKQIKERIRFLVLEANNGLKGNQTRRVKFK